MSDELLSGIRAYREDGMSHRQAFVRASLAEKLINWPEDWDDELHVLLYGVLEVAEPVEFPELRITVLPERQTDALFKSWAYEAVVEIESRDLPGVMDGVERLETLLGLLSAVGLGRAAHWSCRLFDRFVDGPLLLDPAKVSAALGQLSKLDDEPRALVKRAAWWLRAFRSSMLVGNPAPSEFVHFIGAWNAFECLVGAVCKIEPPEALSRQEKNRQVEEFFLKLGRSPTAADVGDCYQTIVNPGQKARISHALNWCYRDIADQYEEEMFGRGGDERGLYGVRNDIHHGNIVESDLNSIILMTRALPRIERIAMAVCHLVLGRGIWNDETKRSCFTCSHMAEDDSCVQGQRPADKEYWRFVCAGFEAAEHYRPEDAFSWPAESSGA